MSATVKGVHFVGSFPKDVVPDVPSLFRTLCARLPGRLERIPDGELDDRWNYIVWQMDVFPANTLISFGDSAPVKSISTYVPRLEDIKEVQYDKMALESYEKFVSAQQSGIIPPGVKFQVSLPNPLDPVMFVQAEYQSQIAPFYEQRLFESTKRILDAIPAESLALQWDGAPAIGYLEFERGNSTSYIPPPWFSDCFDHVVQTYKRCLALAERSVDQGLHLCYGDLKHKHFREPDLGLLVRIANEFSDSALKWVHMPVPAERVDPEYFAPLKNLKLPAGCQLVLGLVHPNDLEGTKDRAALALEAYPQGFAVSQECGLARILPEDLESILDICSKVAAPISTV